MLSLAIVYDILPQHYPLLYCVIFGTLHTISFIFLSVLPCLDLSYHLSVYHSLQQSPPTQAQIRLHYLTRNTGIHRSRNGIHRSRNGIKIVNKKKDSVWRVSFLLICPFSIFISVWSISPPTHPHIHQSLQEKFNFSLEKSQCLRTNSRLKTTIYILQAEYNFYINF